MTCHSNLQAVRTRLKTNTGAWLRCQSVGEASVPVVTALRALSEARGSPLFYEVADYSVANERYQVLAIHGYALHSATNNMGSNYSHNSFVLACH
eukprot:SAG31_NODE_1389_length_8545_cov_3.081103_1_plen_95_part_00